MTAEEIEAAFRERGVMRGEMLLLRVGDALALIESARQHKVRVLGADAFRLIANGIQPLMEHSLDLSSGPLRDDIDTWTRLSEFIERYSGTDLYFEIVLA